jgi:hypothetical protein
MFLFPVSTVHETFDAVFQVHNIEVYKQAERFATEFKVRKELGFVDGRYRIYGLDFDYHEVFDEEIHAIAQFELDLTIDDRKADLSCGVKSILGQFILEARRVGAFEQARAQFGVNSHGRSNNGVADLVG